MSAIAMLRQLSRLPELVFPSERDNAYDSRNNWNGGEYPRNSIQKRMVCLCQPVEATNQTGGPDFAPTDAFRVVDTRASLG